MIHLPVQHRPVTPANPLWLPAARHFAMAAIAFSLSVAAIMILAHRQDWRDNPLTSMRLTQLKTALVQRPTDEPLKQQIRELDQTLRQHHFRRRATLARGGYLLLAGAIVALVCSKYVAKCRVAMNPPGTLPPPVDPLASAPLARRSISVAAVAFGATLALIAIQPASQVGVPAKAMSTTMPVSWPGDEELARNWPVFRGSNIGIASGNIPTDWDGPSGRNVLWKTPVPLAGNNSPIVWNNFVFLSGATKDKQQVFCFDAVTGSMLWQKDVGNPNPTRAPKVMEEGGYAPCTMATDGQRAFAIFPTGDVVAIDFAGRIVWSKNLGLPESQYGYAASLVMWQDRLIIQLDQGLEADAGKSALLALDSATGKPIWRTPRPVANSWASPIVVTAPTGPQIITASQPWVIAYEPQRGTEIWRVKCLRGDVAPSPAFANGIVVVAQESAKVSAIKIGGAGDVTASHVAWSDDFGLPDIVSPVATSRHTFLVMSYGSVTCYDMSSGKMLWTHDIDGSFHASPIAVGNVIMLVDRKGITHRFEDAAEFKLINEPALGEPVSATPAIANNRIYIRGEKNLYCIGSK